VLTLLKLFQILHNDVIDNINKFNLVSNYVLKVSNVYNNKKPGQVGFCPDK
jgi:hypothetical protein